MEKTLAVKFVGDEDHTSGLQQIPFDYHYMGETDNGSEYGFRFNDEETTEFNQAEIERIESALDGMADVESYQWL